MPIMNRVVVLTALPVEYAAICRLLTDYSEERHSFDTIYDRGSFGTWDVLLAQVGAGNVAAAQETERALAYFDPQLALFVGIAGGIKDVSIGDVVAATKVYGYESGADRETFQTRPEVGISSYQLIQEARAVARRPDWRVRITTPSGTDPQAFVAPIAAGEKVVKASAGAVAALLRESYGDALAVEMEASGFLRAAYASGTDALVIRGISDILDGKSLADASGSQERASDNAAAFAFEILARLGTRPPRVVREGSSKLRVEDDNSDGIWRRLRDIAARLYPLGPQEGEVWADAGGDVSRLSLAGNGRTQWTRAIRLLQNGGGGNITIAQLVGRMLDDFSNSKELQDLNGSVSHV